MEMISCRGFTSDYFDLKNRDRRRPAWVFIRRSAETQVYVVAHALVYLLGLILMVTIEVERYASLNVLLCTTLANLPPSSVGYDSTVYP